MNHNLEELFKSAIGKDMMFDLKSIEGLQMHVYLNKPIIDTPSDHSITDEIHLFSEEDTSGVVIPKNDIRIIEIINLKDGSGLITEFKIIYKSESILTITICEPY